MMEYLYANQYKAEEKKSDEKKNSSYSTSPIFYLLLKSNICNKSV